MGAEARHNLEVETFGGLRITVDGTAPAFVYRKSAAVVVYLACSGGRASRSILANLLWSDLDESRALANLRVVLNDLRKHLGPAIISNRESLSLNQDNIGRIDTDDFADAQERLNGDACAVYRGPFLEGFMIGRAEVFDEWVAAERGRYHRHAISSLRIRARHDMECGDLHAAIESFSQIVSLEPWHESARRGLMRALAESGNPDAAIDEYHRLRETLSNDLMGTPQSTTTDLAEEIVRSTRPSRPRTSRPRHLPTPASPVIGREREIRLIGQVLSESSHRLVTLIGPGGVGKTRLALEVAALHGKSTRQDTVMVDLSGITSHTDIPATIALAMRVPWAGIREPVEELQGHLSSTQAILVLDNLEHLLPGAATLVSSLLETCPYLVLVVTSRTRIGLGSEFVIRVPPLQVPPPGTPAAIATKSPAVSLFLARANASGAMSGNTEEEAGSTPDGKIDDIAELCRRLDGLPLGLELAASHAPYLSPREIADNLLSASGQPGDGIHSVDRPMRHRTLTESIGWSYRLLGDDAKELLRCLGVFRSGAPLDVLDAGFRAGLVAPATVRSLLESSLADRQDSVGSVRLRLMESTREFARRELTRTREYGEVSSCHRRAFLDFAIRCDRQLRTEGQMEALSRLDLESDNLRAALFDAQANDPPAALHLANALTWYWNLRGLPREGEEWINKAIAATDGDNRCDEARAQAKLGISLLALRRGGLQVRDQEDVARIVRYLGEAEQFFHARGDEFGLAEVAHMRGIQVSIGDSSSPDTLAAAIAGLEHAADVLRASGKTWHYARVGCTLSALLRLTGDFDRAASVAIDCTAAFGLIGDRRGEAMSLIFSGMALHALGILDAASPMLRSGLAGAVTVGDVSLIISGLFTYGCHLVTEADALEKAARLIGAGQRLCENSGISIGAPWQRLINQYASSGRAAAGDAMWDRAFNEGWSLGYSAALLG